ncbi:MAG: rhodanese-like domain-containing protein [Flavobacteriales bacterium]|nr:rhodanese-like domain-containing protein [Flavobacteriales bacterium]
MIAVFMASQCVYGQQTASCEQAEFDAEVRRYLSFEVHAIDVSTLWDKREDVIILDARESEEYRVSHIPGAIHVGYRQFDPKSLESIPKEASIVVYCSIGYRSEKIAGRIQDAGFKHVENVFGSIFEWTNRGYPLVDARGEPTERLHTYSRKWSRWVNHPSVIKTW